MTYLLRLDIPIYETTLCLAYPAVAERLTTEFPEASLAEGWAETGEYERLEASLQRLGTDEERKKTMLRQIRHKQISHGPTLAFTMPAPDGEPGIQGSFNRWGITFRREAPFSSADHERITTFLQSFGIGTVEPDQWE